MYKNKYRFTLILLACGLSLALAGDEKKKDKADKAPGEITATSQPLLWTAPENISGRDLTFGPGGKEHQPVPPFTFVEEDMNGTNPKFEVKDANGTKWKVKMGSEARPETVATRLVWAVGYFADEDYFLADLHADGMPALHRGQNYVDASGTVHNVRLKKRPSGYEKQGEWKWADNPFNNTREFNGLRVMMAIMNNWDVKDVNNAIYGNKKTGEQIYVVTDLGASLGPANMALAHRKTKGSIDSYSKSKFIAKVRADSIDFDAPGRPSVFVMANPREYAGRRHLEWIGNNIPIDDARWIGKLLAQLSPQQIGDAFLAAGYPPEEVQSFVAAFESRIAEIAHI